MKPLENLSNELSLILNETESRLTRHNYLSRQNLPGWADGTIIRALESSKRYPHPKIHSNFYYWFITMKQFSILTINNWISSQLYKANDELIISLTNQLQNMGIFYPIANLVREHQQKIDEQMQFRSVCCDKDIQNMPDFHSMKVGNGSSQYVIDITLKQKDNYSNSRLSKLLNEYKASIINLRRDKIRISCQMQCESSTQMADQISKCIEYDHMQIKKKKKIKTLSTICLGMLQSNKNYF